jgi:hypothetical protein
MPHKLHFYLAIWDSYILIIAFKVSIRTRTSNNQLGISSIALLLESKYRPLKANRVLSWDEFDLKQKIPPFFTNIELFIKPSIMILLNFGEQQYQTNIIPFLDYNLEKWFLPTVTPS